MNSNHDFSDAKIGDLVTSLRHGLGSITAINPNSMYPIFVEFINENGQPAESDFDTNGFWFDEDFASMLFKGHIDINSLSINYNTI